MTGEASKFDIQDCVAGFQVGLPEHVMCIEGRFTRILGELSLCTSVSKNISKSMQSTAGLADSKPCWPASPSEPARIIDGPQEGAYD